MHGLQRQHVPDSGQQRDRITRRQQDIDFERPQQKGQSQVLDRETNRAPVPGERQHEALHVLADVRKECLVPAGEEQQQPLLRRNLPRERPDQIHEVRLAPADLARDHRESVHRIAQENASR